MEDVAGPGKRSCTQNLKLKITGHMGEEAKGGQSKAETERPGDVGISGRAQDLFLFSFPGGQGHWPQELIRLQWGTPSFIALSQEVGDAPFCPRLEIHHIPRPRFFGSHLCVACFVGLNS